MRDIVFDLGGVLIDWNPRYLFRDHLGGEPGAVEAFLGAVCTEAWHSKLDAGASFVELTAELAARHPHYDEWIRRYASDWERMFAGALEETVEQVGRLKRRGFRLHALSNYPAERIRFLYRAFPFMADFQTVVLSGLVGATKPDERIYAYLLERIGRRQCLFIDDRAENVEAARRCGMRAVRFVRGTGFAEIAEILGA
ncbi:MAG: HAD family phosphatase [Gammaproteobacteria bacterium]|nr:HAD family phosphatase [Gammaproteobacteria bacterium]